MEILSVNENLIVLAAIIGAFPAVLVGLFTVHYTRKQTNLALFKERYEIFKDIESILRDVFATRNDSVESHVLDRLHGCLLKAEFLFGKEIGEFVEDLKSKVIEYNSLKFKERVALNEVNEMPNSQFKDQFPEVDDLREITNYFISERQILNEKFKEYLTI